jgi:glycosyltransferase involved in cell wall biosynthesis
MRINLLSFLDPGVYAGGGEMISRRLFEVGVARGHDIRVTSVRPRKVDLHEAPQLSLLIDIFNFGHTLRSLGAWRTFNAHFIEKQIQKAPFVHLTNAYADVCNLPYLPCSGHRTEDCPAKPGLGVLEQLTIRDWGNTCFAQEPLLQRLYKESALNVFLSPLHQRISESLLGGVGLASAYVLKPMIDTQRFANTGQERDIEYLFVGVIGEAKGLRAMRERFGNADIHLIGRCAPGIKLDFGNHLGHVPYDEVPLYMNRAKNFVFLPRWPEPQGRVVAEAALCGCNIIGNGNVGALSFNMDLSDPQNYAGVEDEFWVKLENLI